MKKLVAAALLTFGALSAEEAPQKPAVSAATAPDAAMAQRMADALNNGDSKVVEEIVKATNGAALHWRFSDGYTPLLAAAANGDIKTATVLIQAKTDKAIDLHARNKNGMTALMLASFLPKDKGYDVVLLLLETGAHASDKLPESGATALHLAIMRDNYKIVDLILQDGLSANTPFRINFTGKDGTDNFIDGYTPLMLAVDGGEKSEPIVKLLLKRGANKHLKNEFGETAIDRAKKTSKKLFQLLDDKPKVELSI